MTLGNFQHVAVRSVDEALAAAEGGDAVFNAGGTDLLGILKDHVHQRYPARLVDLKPIRELAFVREGGDGLAVGALTSLAEIAAHPAVRAGYGLLAEAARAVASPQIRNMATIGGNICQEPRCWYYRYPENGFACLRKGGRSCSALLGENRFHSIFGAARVGRPSCSDECPDEIDIPAYMELVRSGDLDEAARILLQRNPLPAVTGRVCPHYCERGCNRNLFDESVSIRSVERRLGDRILERSEALYGMPAARSGRRVAVVGAGPAGLAAAFYLRRAGHEVRVIDRMPEAGGMLRYSIPPYRLPHAVLRSLVASFEKAGIVFELGVEVGSGGRSLEALRREHDAVFLATGTWGQRSLDIEGSGLLESGIDFLKDSADLGSPSSRAGMAGKEVLVVGGGNVAVDVAITARRLGAKRVTMICLESRDEMPAFPEEIEEALREGVGLLPSWGPKRAVIRGGILAGMEFVACASVFDAQGRFAPSFDAGRTMSLDADRVILAIGQAAELGYLGGLVGSERGRIRADAETQATEADGIFAGGDAVTGPASVIQAVAAGRRAAEAISATFGAAGGAAAFGGASFGGTAAFGAADAGVRDGAGTPAGAAAFGAATPDGAAAATAARSPAGAATSAAPFAPSLEDEGGTRSGALHGLRAASLEHSPRTKAPELPVEERRFDLEDVATIGEAEAAEEAGRCLDCSCVAVNASDIAPALLALGASVHTTRRRLDAEDFFAVRRYGTTRLLPGELVTEIRIPTQRKGCRFAFQKFRIRKSIDFPIVSVASAISLEGGRIVEARLAFGAVAPLPLRAREVERFLVGRVPDEATAEEAGLLAIRGAVALEQNGYKLQILKALVRKAILALG